MLPLLSLPLLALAGAGASLALTGQPAQNGTLRAVPGRVALCHRTGARAYARITVARVAVRVHLAHGDLYPVPAAGCPATVVMPTKAPIVPTTPSDPRTTVVHDGDEGSLR